jgi:hypothetical protein
LGFEGCFQPPPLQVQLSGLFRRPQIGKGSCQVARAQRQHAVPGKGLGEARRPQVRPGQDAVNRDIDREVGEQDDATPIEDRPHPIDGLDDLGLPDLLEEFLAPRVGVRLDHLDAGAAVAQPAGTTLPGVAAEGNERLRVGGGKRACQSLDGARARLLAPEDETVSQVSNVFRPRTAPKCVTRTCGGTSGCSISSTAL